MKDADRFIEGMRRQLTFHLKTLEQEAAELHGKLATARGELGRIERLIRENEREANEVRKKLSQEITL